MNSFAITDMLPSRARIASFATVLALLTMLSAPFAFVAMAAGGAAHSNPIDEKPMCYAAGVGCGAGPSMEIALFAPRH
jgi:hypothetical protein